jgi:hypothetical protein
MNWYPCRRYLSINGGPEVQMRDDIECGEDWYETQVCDLTQQYFLLFKRLNYEQTSLGPEKVLAPGLVYADETIISRFHDVTYHPVLLFLGSLPSWIRNGYGYGGAILIGWLPKVI